MSSIDFTTVINMFAMEGMVALGKLKHPGTGNIERNLEQAKFIIDLLGVLQTKTKGNLDGTESSFLEQTVSTLRLNYVQENSSNEITASAPVSDGIA